MPPSATGTPIPADPKILQKMEPAVGGLVPRFDQEELGQIQTMIHADPSLESYFERALPDISAYA